MAADSKDCNTNVNALPVVDLSGLVYSGPGSIEWKQAQKKVEWALMNYGGFDAIYNRIGSDVVDGLFEKVVPETVKNMEKISNASTLPTSGWFIFGDFAFNGLHIYDPDSLSSLEDYAKTVWPQGNSLFCNTVCNYAKHMKDMAQIIHKMILDSLNLEDVYDSHINSVAYSLRFTEYFNDMSIGKKKIGIPPHVDANYINIINQYEVEGLEVEASNGEWIHVPAVPNTFTILLGETFAAFTNGIFKAPKHQVKMENSRKRYSVIFTSFPSYNSDVIKSPDKLVDESHPLIYKPFNYYEYLKLRFTNQDTEGDLKTYFGIETQG
ncbi:hypothetical protein HPP92_007491 [Vanilla planifolia]|uniref:Isopenicillin N synthase-like Fe(2+) 2OG dioxygenase domain-containing protein n=1 Tax=Vanilla planifolia TaxID=51239 RepID=A0A835V9H1_VANPL|nr:hypothetical protein HPP92_007491 [Vanilla planifolia]